MYYFSCLVYVCWLGCYCSVHMYCISLSRVVNLLFCSFSHYSFAQNCYVIFNIGREGFAHVAHHKKATVSDSLFKIYQCEWFACYSTESLAKNERFARKICTFRMFLTVFPFACVPNSESILSLFAHLLFFLRATWAIRSHRSLQNSHHALAICSGSSWQKSDGNNSLFFTSESLSRSQNMSEFPTLCISLVDRAPCLVTIPLLVILRGLALLIPHFVSPSLYVQENLA